MNRIKLKRILAKEEIVKIINQIVDVAKTPISIEEDGVVIYGEVMKQPQEKYSIRVGSDILGWVKGNKVALTIASLLTTIAKEELEIKSLATEALERYKEINIMYNLPTKIGTTTGTKNIAKIIIDEVMKYVNCSSVAIMLLDEATGELVTFLEVYKRKDAEITLKYRKNVIDLDYEVIQTVLKKGSGEIVNNVAEVELGVKENNTIQSMICVPLTAKNKIIGVMVVGSEREGEYKSADLKLCSVLAFQAGIGIQNEKLYDNLKETFFDTVQTLAEIIEMRDSYTEGHTKAVTSYSLTIARAMDLPKVDLVKVKLASMLHNIGTVGIPDALLKKKELSKEEFEIIKQHPVVGSEMLKKINQLKGIVPAIRGHHERYDGTGYPDGLKGEEIPIVARVIAVADAIDAMLNNRQYREALTVEGLIEELLKNRAMQFDPKVVDVAIEICKDKSLEEIERCIGKE